MGIVIIIIMAVLAVVGMISGSRMEGPMSDYDLYGMDADEFEEREREDYEKMYNDKKI